MVGWQGSWRSRGAQHRSGWIQWNGSMDGRMDKRMADESLCGPIILIAGEELTPPFAPEVQKKTSTFSNSFATRGLCENRFHLLDALRMMWTEEPRLRPFASCGMLSFCSNISSLALWGSRGSSGLFQDLGPASRVLRGTGLQTGQYVLEQS